MKITDIIKKLNTLDINDIQNIDWEKVKDYFRLHPDLVINIIIILITTYIGIYTFTNSHHKLKELQLEKSQLTEKLSIVKNLKSIDDDYQKFIDEFPKPISIEELSSELAKIAENNNIEISAFTPGNIREDKTTESVIISLTVSAKTFKDITLFAKEIEESPYALYISNWLSRPSNQLGNSTDDQTIEVTLKIGTVKIKK